MQIVINATTVGTKTFKSKITITGGPDGDLEFVSPVEFQNEDNAYEAAKQWAMFAYNAVKDIIDCETPTYGE